MSTSSNRPVVFVVMREFDYEGGSVKGVFATEEAAIAFARGSHYEPLPEPHRPHADILRFDTGSSSYDVVRWEVRP
jgi:hypothetical protein